MKTLLVATNNSHKLQELIAELGDVEYKVVTPQEVNVPEEFDPEETGKTFAENALLKAKAFAQETGLLTVADDSGAVVHALNGEPGIYSKRWIEGSDHDRNMHLLKMLSDKSDRSAHYNCTLALYDPETDYVESFEGQVHGTIGFEEQGTEGFGYDPVFIPDGFAQTFAQLGNEQKMKISHRHRALTKLKAYLQNL